MNAISDFDTAELHKLSGQADRLSRTLELARSYKILEWNDDANDLLADATRIAAEITETLEAR